MDSKARYVGLFLTVSAILAAVFVPMAQAAWLPPVAISASGEHTGNPHVALDSEGNATAVWESWNGSDTVVESAFRAAGEAWGPAEDLSEPEVEGEFPPGAHDAQAPQVVVDRNGNLTVIWERYAWPTLNIESVSRAPGGSWTEPIVIAETSQGASPEPWLAVDSEGNNSAVWKQGEVIMSSFRPFAGEWEKPVALSAGESSTPQAAMDARGDATAVWMHDDGSHLVVESDYRPEQGKWDAAALVSQPGEEAGNPHVAIDAKGDALVIWRGEDEGHARVRAAYRTADGSWSQPVDVSSEGEQVESLRAAVDPAGNAIAVWSGDRNEVGGWSIVHAAFKAAAGKWEEPVELSSEGGNGFPSDVVFDSSGNAAAVWERWDGVTNLVQAAYKPAGEEWEPAVDLSEEGEQGMDAVVVLDAPGDATAADGDATAIWASGATSCPEGGKSSCSSYAIQAAGFDPNGTPEVTVEAPTEGTVGEPLEVSTPTEDLYSPVIEFGDGESIEGTEATHTYEEPGEYEVVAGGAEELGYRASTTQTITIRPLGEGPGPKESGGEKPTEAPRGGEEQSAPPPQIFPPSPSASACASASAAKEAAAQRLLRTERRLRGAAPPRRARLLAAKRRAAAQFSRARVRFATLC